MILDITWKKLQKKLRGDSGDAYVNEVDEY